MVLAFEFDFKKKKKNSEHEYASLHNYLLYVYCNSGSVLYVPLRIFLRH